MKLIMAYQEYAINYSRLLNQHDKYLTNLGRNYLNQKKALRVMPKAKRRANKRKGMLKMCFNF